MAETPVLGVASWNIDAATLPDRVEWIVAHEFTAISLHVDVMDCEPSERAEAAAAVRDAGLVVTFHGVVGYDESAQVDWDRFERIMAEVVWWQEQTKNVYSLCYDPMFVATDEGGKRFDPPANREVLLATAERLEPHGVRVGIENTYGGRGFCSIAELAAFLDSCERPTLGMLLDTGHANIHVRSGGVKGEADVGEFVHAIPFDVLEVHFSDNHGETDEHLPLGAGNVDLRAVLGALKRKGFDGVLTVEVCPGLKARRLDVPEEMDQILRTRDAIAETWAEV